MPALRSPFIRVGHISSWHMQPLVCQSFSSVNDVTATWLPLNSSKLLTRIVSPSGRCTSRLEAVVLPTVAHSYSGIGSATVDARY